MTSKAGAHFTSRDIIYLMTELLVAPEKAEIMAEGCTKTAYDIPWALPRCSAV